MKKILILILLIIITLPSFAKEVINFDKTCDKEASKILYEYQLQEHEMTPQKAYETFGYKLSDVYAVFYDLNSDGINEIIGFVNVPYSYSRDGANLYILKKKEFKSEDISGINAYPFSGIYILDTKTSGFKDIMVFATMQHKPIIAKYNKQYYEYFSSD